VMRETFGRDDCGRAGQLLGYLYGESGTAERADFERHLPDCAACRDELAAFTHVRGSVAEFRAELLQTAPAVSLEGFAAAGDLKPAATHDPRARHASHASLRAESASRTPPAGFASPVAAPRASASAAWAALREFFRLSPLWLRASTVAAAVAIFAFALLAVLNAEVSFGGERYAIRMGTRPAAAPPASAPATPEAQSEEFAAMESRLERLAAERDAAVRELEETREQLDDSRAANLVAAGFETEPGAQSGSSSSRDERRRRRASPASNRSATPSRATRRSAEDEDLPRLLDLLGGAN
ncbi:MAG TPA: hypothetical protein VK421_05230, partial [Pyrinomonadaceae bacterium]|nr:hypothetical protein [Pyrinomonadaceae bacterium]